MDAETDYIEYVTSFSLSILAVSASYFLNLSRPATYFTLLMIPILYGYTAYISRKGFRRSSLLSAIGLFFIPLSPLMAIIGILITVGNPLVSVFSGGERFHDYFRAVSIPLLITGLIIGVTGFYMLKSQPELKQEFVDTTSKKLGEQTAAMAESTKLAENYQNVQVEIVRQTSKASIATAQGYVLNETADNLTIAQRNQITGAFISAQREIPEKLANKTQAKMKEKNGDLGSTAESSFKNLLNQPNAMLALIPFATVFIYGLNPLLGILTGIMAMFFQSMDRKYEIFPPT